MTFRKALVALMPALFALASADAAWAGTDCFTLDGQGKVTLDNSTATGTFTATPIYVAGSTALEPLLKAIGPGVTGGASPYVIIYEKTLGSCGGVGLVTGSMPIPHGNPMFYVPLGADGTTNKTCTYPTTAPTPADPPFTVVLSDVDSKLCPGSPALPTGFTDFHGPVNDMVFVVPPMSQQKAISAEQAYLMLGLGADGMATPWIDPAAIFIRSNTSGTRAMINALIGVGAHDWKGTPGTGSGDVLGKVMANNLTAAEKTIGILGEDFYDSSTSGVNNRSYVTALAFRAFRQMKAYWPDSTVNSRDRINVREGRYPIWGYVHMIAAATGATASNAVAQYFIDVIQGNLASPPVDALDLTVKSHLTPTCAMKVTHDIEGGAQKPYTPAAPCGCAFETKVAGTAPASCKACPGGDADCAGGAATHCRFGYCEQN